MIPTPFTPCVGVAPDTRWVKGWRAGLGLELPLRPALLNDLEPSDSAVAHVELPLPLPK
jgi:hypothetical protein